MFSPKLVSYETSFADASTGVTIAAFDNIKAFVTNGLIGSTAYTGDVLAGFDGSFKSYSNAAAAAATSMVFKVNFNCIYTAFNSILEECGTTKVVKVIANFNINGALVTYTFYFKPTGDGALSVVTSLT
jgi:hypothetical protein